MKTRFTFTLELGHAQLGEKVSIKFATGGEIAVQEGPAVVPLHVEDYDVEIEIEPESDGARPGEYAHLRITVSGTPESVSPFVERLASQIVEHLAFYYDRLRLLGGMVFAECLPESDEERAAIGDKPYSGHARFVEVEPPKPFDREHLRSFPYSFGLERLMRQFAAARVTDNTIDAFLNMFKVVETLFHRGNMRAREALAVSDEFCRLLRVSFRTFENGVRREPTDDDVAAMINQLVETRHNCAHLREHNAFGYAPGDPEVTRRVEPLYEILTQVARSAIQDRIDSKRRNTQEPRGGFT